MVVDYCRRPTGAINCSSVCVTLEINTEALRSATQFADEYVKDTSEDKSTIDTSAFCIDVKSRSRMVGMLDM